MMVTGKGHYVTVWVANEETETTNHEGNQNGNENGMEQSVLSFWLTDSVGVDDAVAVAAVLDGVAGTTLLFSSPPSFSIFIFPLSKSITNTNPVGVDAAVVAAVLDGVAGTALARVISLSFGNSNPGGRRR